MAPQYQKTFIIELPFEQVIKLAKLALCDIGANVCPVDPELGFVLGRIGMNFWSFGENIRVSISDLDNKRMVHIESQSSTKTTLIDWGKDFNNVSRFEKTLLLFSE